MHDNLEKLLVLWCILTIIVLFSHVLVMFFDLLARQVSFEIRVVASFNMKNVVK